MVEDVFSRSEIEASEMASQVAVLTETRKYFKLPANLCYPFDPLGRVSYVAHNSVPTNLACMCYYCKIGARSISWVGCSLKCQTLLSTSVQTVEGGN